MKVTNPNMDAKKDCTSFVSFPFKLHRMLIDAEKEGNESIVSWLPHGRSFKVNNKDEFVLQSSKSDFVTKQQQVFDALHSHIE